ncbi:MAG: hypothetical protein KZQ56_13430 [gamma proteobacterium symbiont of Lucinoma myriamae]|nr:hypothetical protein [gamma proteobacterium symbiont of Lucinoma myriamae]
MIILILLSSATWNGFNFYKNLTDNSAGLVQHTPVIISGIQSKKIPQPKTISGWHLMGENKANKPIKAPKTTLSLKLIGIISSTVDGQARAIIEVSPRKHQYFKVGDDIKQNVNVKFINADHIIINHNSREEIVPLISLKPKIPIIKKVVTK